MLTITQQQLDVFEPKLLEPFLQHITEVVTESFPKDVEKLSEKNLRDRIKMDYKTALHFKIKTERGITRFVCLGFLLGQKFYAQPEFMPIFKTNNYRADSDVDQLYLGIEKALNK